MKIELNFKDLTVDMQKLDFSQIESWRKINVTSFRGLMRINIVYAESIAFVHEGRVLWLKRRDPAPTIELKANQPPEPEPKEITFNG